MQRLIYKFTISAILGVSALATDFPAAAQGALRPAAIAVNNGENEKKSAPRLFASEKTRKVLGAMADYVPRWADMDILVVSELDLASAPSRDIDDLEAAFDEYAKTIDGFPFERLVREKLKRYLARNAGDSSPHAFPMPARMPGEKPVCAISIPLPQKVTKEALVTAICGIPGRAADTIPGTVEDWLLLVIAHEAGHSPHSYDDRRPVVGLQMECEADQHAINIYMRDAEKILGPRRDIKAVPQALIALRGIQAMESYNIIHSTSAGIAMPGDEPVCTDREILSDAVVKAQKAVWSMAKYNKVSLDDRLGYRPRPEKMYRAARTLFDQGYFDGKPVQKQFVSDFLKGAENYFTTYFGVQPAPQRKSAPTPLLAPGS